MDGLRCQEECPIALAKRLRGSARFSLDPARATLPKPRLELRANAKAVCQGGVVRVLTLLCGGVAACLIAVAADASYVDGNKLKELLDVAAKAQRGKSKGVKDAYGTGYVIGYIAGVADTYNGVLLCSTPNVPLRQIVSIVRKRIHDHPEDLNRPADSIIVSALSAAFPCKPN